MNQEAIRAAEIASAKGGVRRLQAFIESGGLGAVVPLELYDRAVNQAQEVIATVRPDQLPLPTPCTEWDVRAVIDHMIAGSRMVLVFAGEQPSLDPGADQVGDDPSTAFAEAAAAAAGALRRGQPLQLPVGETPASVVAVMRAIDLLLHTWDVAKATGQATALNPELCEQVLQASRVLLAEAPRHPGGRLGPEIPVPADASVCDRLVGYHGRQP